MTDSSRTSLLDQRSLENEKKQARAIKLGDSDSDSEDDLADMSRRLAERRRAQSKSQKNTIVNNEKTLQNSNLWSDDDSEEEMDVRQIIARKVVEKRKRESIEAMSSENNQTSKVSSQAASQEGGFGCTPKVCDKIKAPPSPIQNNHAPRSEKTTSNGSRQAPSSNSSMCNVKESMDNMDSLSSKEQRHLQQSSLKVEAEGDKPYSKLAASASKALEQPPESIDNSKQKDEHTPEAKRLTTSTTLQSTAKSTIASTTAGSTTASTKLPSQKASLQELPSSLNLDKDPIIGKEVRTRSNVEWSVHKQCLLVRTVGSCSPKVKVAGFDLDQTLVNWRCAGWPSRPEHYELWNSIVIERLRQLHDNGYKLVLFSNQGGIKNAFHGKKSGTVKGIIDWIAKLVDRPLFAVCSTKKNAAYHKGNPGMWGVMEDYCNCGKRVRPDLSFYVGDADGIGDDTANLQQQQHQQTGTDKLFAENVGEMRNTTMDFFSPSDYFGPSNVDCRRTMTSLEAPPDLPKEAILARAALLGGYLRGPILALTIGVQGSGKSTFCQSLIDNSGGAWCQFSQDTIRNGVPGTRQAVEEAAREALCNGKNVVIDRMHLDAEQRSYFLQLGKQCQVPVHGLVMLASKEEVEDRVKRRVNHPGKVEGVNGARIAVASLSKLKLPRYDEGFALISYSHQTEGKLAFAYRRVDSNISDEVHMPKTIELYNAGKVRFPMITLGTMNIRKQETTTVISRAIEIGMESIDTAPTYNNENEIGTALRVTENIHVSIKLPKRVTSPEQAREEVMKSLSLLKRSRVDTILLHWPCDLIVADTLSSVWKELEAMKKEGLCRVLGVCNFTIMALKMLLSRCVIKPALNQVERHPLLPQHELLEYCDSQGIITQAHSPLGNGSKFLLENDIIVRVAQESDMSPAQVLLCWNLQHSIPVATKFSSEKHGKEVAELLHEKSKLTLSPQHMKAIDNLSLSGDSHRFVAPPFMYRRGAAYSWGDTPPKSW